MPEKQKEKKKVHPNVVAREMPNNFDAESALLGSMLIDNDIAADCLLRLVEDDFYSYAHRVIFKAIANLVHDQSVVDLLTVVQQLTNAGDLETAGGAQYIGDLTGRVPSASNAAYYLDIVLKNSKLRRVIRIANEMADLAYSYDPEGNVIESAEANIYALSNADIKADRLRPVKPALESVMNDFRERQSKTDAFRGIPTGFSQLNGFLGGGLQNSDLVLIAGRPGEGKTSFAMNLVQNAAFYPNLKSTRSKNSTYAVAVFSLEMSADQLARRLLCSVANVKMSDGIDGKFKTDDWRRVDAAVKELSDLKIYIDDTTQITPTQILSKCRRLKSREGLDLIVIDYLQLMTSGKRFDSRVLEIADMTRTLKVAAKELNIPIVLLSQMSRDYDKRKDFTPQLSDLRDSGAIEQDADVIMFISNKNKGEVSDNVRLVVAKNRNGATGFVNLRWRRENVTFVEIDTRYEDPAAAAPPKTEHEKQMKDKVDSVVKKFSAKIKADQAANSLGAVVEEPTPPPETQFVSPEETEFVPAEDEGLSGEDYSEADEDAPATADVAPEDSF